MADLLAPHEPTPVTPTLLARGRLFVEWSAMLFLATLLVSGLLLSGVTSRLDNALYDFALGFRGRPAPPDIIIVAIDSPSMMRLGPWPWARSVQAAMLRNIARDHPRAVALDTLYQAKGPSAGDRDIHDAMKQAPVFLPEFLEAPAKGHPGFLTRPTPEIGSAAAGLGLAASMPDRDGIIRHALLGVRLQGQILPELMVAVAAQSPEHMKAASATGRAAGAHPVVHGEVLIPYAGPSGHFHEVSAADVVDGPIAAGAFKDKYVLVGATAPGLHDNYPTPVSGAEGMPNIEVEANILDAILHHHMIRQLPIAANLALSLGLVWLLFFGILQFEPRQMVIQGPIFSLIFLVSSVASLALLGVWFTPISALITRSVVQVIWSSRRLQAASDYFAKELAELEIRAGGVLVPARTGVRLPMGDSVSRQMLLIDATKQRIRVLRRFVTDVLANLPDPVLVVSRRGRIITVNQAAADLGARLGRPTDPGAQVQPILQDLEMAAGGKDKLWPPSPPIAGAPAPRGLGPGGRIFEARYSPTGHDEEVARGWTIHLIDVTALVSAMRQREEALQLFTHDMRSPQSAILAALEHKDFQTVPLALRDGIERNALRTLTLADGFVRLAQAEATEYAFEPNDLFHILGDAADAIWPIAQAASVEIVVEDPAHEFVVNADRALLARALINLLDNAVKFSPPGKSVICVLRPATLLGRAAVSCIITDQASGMSQEQQKSLFKRFARSPLADDDGEGRPVRSNSIGLGLAVVHTVVVRHDGVVDCRSEVGEGTVFTITLPLHVGEVDNISPGAS